MNPINALFRETPRDQVSTQWGPFAFELGGTTSAANAVSVTTDLDWLPLGTILWSSFAVLSFETDLVAGGGLHALLDLMSTTLQRRARLGGGAIVTPTDLRDYIMWPLEYPFVAGKDRLRASFTFTAVTTGAVGRLSIGGLITPRGNVAQY